MRKQNRTRIDASRTICRNQGLVHCFSLRHLSQTTFKNSRLHGHNKVNGALVFFLREQLGMLNLVSLQTKSVNCRNQINTKA